MTLVLARGNARRAYRKHVDSCPACTAFGAKPGCCPTEVSLWLEYKKEWADEGRIIMSLPTRFNGDVP